MTKRHTSFASLVFLAGCLFSSNAWAQTDAQDAYYEEQAPIEGVYYEDGTYYEEQAPAEGTYYEEQAPADGVYYEEQAPANGVYYEDGGYYEEQAPAEGTYYEEQAPATDVYFAEQAGIITQGFFLHAALSIPNGIGEGNFKDGGGSYTRGAGFGVNLQAIYRTDATVGFGLEQRIEGIFNYRTGYYEKGEGVFLGATFAVIQEYIHHEDYGLFTFTQGIGIAYGANNKKLFSDSPDRSFAMKVDFGYTYFIQSIHGVGITLDIMYAVYVDFQLYAAKSFLLTFTPMITYTRFF